MARKGKKRGPKGGMKHQPGHDRKSKPHKAKKFRHRAKQRREELREAARVAWAKYDAMSEAARKILGDRAIPKYPRPRDEN